MNPFEPALEPVMHDTAERVIADLSDLDFMDSSGIALLLQLARRSRSLQLQEPSKLMRRIIEANGLSGVLHLET
jgi:anti-anti-sigma factor